MFVQLLGKIDITKLKKVCSEEDMIRFHIQEVSLLLAAHIAPSTSKPYGSSAYPDILLCGAVRALPACHPAHLLTTGRSTLGSDLRNHGRVR